MIQYSIATGCLGLCRGADPLPEVGVAVFFNPTDQSLATNISIPLYYTGLETTATISIDEGPQVGLGVGERVRLRS